MIAFLINPHSAGGRGQKLFDQAISKLREQKLVNSEIVSFSSGALSDVESWARQCAGSGVTNFAAAGGDGTVNLLVNALMNIKMAPAALPPQTVSDFSLGAIGIGSSNDFHKPAKNKIGAIPFKLDFAKAALSDVAWADLDAGPGPDKGNGNSARERRYFIVNSSVGITSDANYYFNHPDGPLAWLKSFWTGAAINWAALRTIAKYKKVAVEITAPDGPRQIQLSNLGVIKKAYFSGSFHYDRAPAPDDGQLWVHIAHDMSLFELIKTTMKLSKGEFTGRPKTMSFSAPRFELKSLGEPLSVELDGEVFKSYKTTWAVAPRALKVCP